MFSTSRYRISVSITVLGAGETPPLLRLIMLRSTVNACRTLNQKSSSRATVSAGRLGILSRTFPAFKREPLSSVASSPAEVPKKRLRCMTLTIGLLGQNVKFAVFCMFCGSFGEKLYRLPATVAIPLTATSLTARPVCCKDSIREFRETRRTMGSTMKRNETGTSRLNANASTSI